MSEIKAWALRKWLKANGWVSDNPGDDGESKFGPRCAWMLHRTKGGQRGYWVVIPSSEATEAQRIAAIDYSLAWASRQLNRPIPDLAREIEALSARSKDREAAA